MGRLPSKDKIQRLREMVSAGLSEADICIILGDDFSHPCSKETLRLLMVQNSICWPGHIGKAAA